MLTYSWFRLEGSRVWTGWLATPLGEAKMKKRIVNGLAEITAQTFGNRKVLDPPETHGSAPEKLFNSKFSSVKVSK